MAEKESNKGGLKEALTGKPEDGQDSQRFAGFRERKDAMHSQDGKTK